MSLKAQFILAAVLGLHLLLAGTIAFRDMVATLGSEFSQLPATDRPWLAWIARLSSEASGRDFARSNPVRQFLTAYADCTGIEAGYSYFAPVVPGNSRLAFELHYPDGRVEYDVPVVSGASAGDRVSTLLDHVRFVQYFRLREALLQSLVNSIHREHPDAVWIRAVLGTAELTTPAEYRAGKRTSYQLLFAYDFRYRSDAQSAVDH